jgi:hypothetical protein
MVQIPRFILEDPPLLEKKLQEFQAAETRARDAVALVGEAEEIGQLRSQAAAERDAADAASAETKEECAKLISDAIAQAEDLVNEARTQADELILGAETKLGRAQRVEENAQQAMNKAQEASRTHVALGDRLNRRTEALDIRETDLGEQQQLLLQEKSKLATVREQIDSILG